MKNTEIFFKLPAIFTWSLENIPTEVENRSIITTIDRLYRQYRQTKKKSSHIVVKSSLRLESNNIIVIST